MKQAFTLVELLVVVLIIGVMTSIAIPMYQGAVDKSHWSTMLPAAKAIKDAEEAIKMTNGEYTDTMEHLDVTMNNADLNFTLDVHNNLSDPNVIRVTNPKLGNNVRLASYLDDSPKFAGQLHCEALKTDDRANRLCGKLLSGEYLKESDENYSRYLLDQSVDEATCKAATASWSTSKTKCYKDTATRCTDLGMNDISGVVGGMTDQCGYTNTKGKIVGEEAICVANGGNACSYSTLQNGGKCLGVGGVNHPCYGVTIEQGGICEINAQERSNGCARATVTGGVIICGKNSVNCGQESTINGGACVVDQAGANCYKVKFQNGSICYANAQNCDTDASNYDATSCCCGRNCGSAPKCADRGIACDPQYMK